MKKSIEIDLDVHRAIEMERRTFEESQNDILRRILGLVALERYTIDGEYYGPVNLAKAASIDNPVPDSLSPPSGNQAQFDAEPQASLGERIKEFHSRISGQLFSKKPAAARDWQFGGVRLPEGTRLQKWYGGQKYEAEIRDGAIWFDGVSYQSPSAAAMVITGGSNVSGWNFWKFFDPMDGDWKKLSSLKAGLKEEAEEITKI
jgi:hypothetical protein